MSIEGDDWEIRLQAPRIGEHTLELLAGLGYSHEEINDFMAHEIIACRDSYQ
jgi:crotonobetainyl-CoA:carnitine CoA-transferase CaiB-like acyl-CoA transferase